MINYQALATAFLLWYGKEKRVPAGGEFYMALTEWCESTGILYREGLGHYFVYRYPYDFLKRPHDDPSGCGHPHCTVCVDVRD